MCIYFCLVLTVSKKDDSLAPQAWPGAGGQIYRKKKEKKCKQKKNKIKAPAKGPGFCELISALRDGCTPVFQQFKQTCQTSSNLTNPRIKPQTLCLPKVLMQKDEHRPYRLCQKQGKTQSKLAQMIFSTRTKQAAMRKDCHECTTSPSQFLCRPLNAGYLTTRNRDKTALAS